LATSTLSFFASKAYLPQILATMCFRRVVKTTKCISQVGSGRYLGVEVECKAGETVVNLGRWRR
jgi:hypothetical protein